MAILVAIAVTALVVGAGVGAVVQRSTKAALLRDIGGRTGADPVDEHRRLLAESHQQIQDAHRQAQLLQLALGGLTSGVVVTDASGTVLAKNELAGTIATRSHEQTLLDVATADLLDRAANGHAGERELETFGPPPRTLFIHAVPVTQDRQVVGALAVIDDVTDQHRIEKTRRDFVANLSHELRTPVGAASLLGEMLVDESDADTRRQLTTRLLVETDRMSDTIDGLLELSRIESTEQDYDQEFEIQALVDEALERTRVLAETKAIKVGSVHPIETIAMIGNRDQLLTAVLNLVENAIKYSSADDKVSVRVRVEDGAVCLVVQDTGPGIPPRDLDRIFERFYRVDRSRDSQTGGTGIGLSIVRHVAINHGGSVEVSSHEGDGSTFTMTLPIDSRPTVADVPITHEVT